MRRVRMDSRSLGLWALAIVLATFLTWLELQLDPPPAWTDPPTRSDPPDHVVEMEILP